MIAATDEAMPSGSSTRWRISSCAGVDVTRSSTNPTSLYASFEYQKCAPGANVGGTLRRSVATPSPVGASSVPAARPLVCVSRWCSVIGPNGSGSSSHGSSSLTETCRSSRPASTSWSTTIDANDFEIEPIMKRVSGRTGAPLATSANPRTTTPSVS